MLIERAAQFRGLDELLTESTNGRGGVAVVEGALGSGKTTFLHAFAERALAAGAAVLSATCSPAEHSLPAGVAHQIFADAPLSAGQAERVGRLLGAGGSAQTGVVLHDLCAALLDLSRDQPLVVCVDDAQFADTSSQLWLLYLARRIRRARVVLVLVQSANHRSPRGRFLAELDRHPHCQRITLPPLTPDGVAELLALQLGTEVAQAIVEDSHAVTGGNPLLVEALAEDQRAAAGHRPGQDGLAVGRGFADAVLACVYHGKPYALEVARAIAVLDEAASVPLVGRLTCREHTDIVEIEADLAAAGLLEGGRFRHPAARRAVLYGLGSAGGADLYYRAARLLYEEGAQPSTVARRLVAAGWAGESWTVPVLQESAEHALRCRDIRRATEELKLAYDGCADEQQRARLRTQLAEAEWHARPAAARRHLPELADALRDGWLTGADATAAVRMLLWAGAVDRAQDAVDRLTGSAVEPVAETEVIRLYLHLVCPGTPGAQLELDATDRYPVSTVVRQDLRAVKALAAVLAGTAGPAIASAEHVLERASLTPSEVGPVVAALLALLYADRIPEVESWSTALFEGVAEQSPTWAAIVDAVRAEAAYRRGDLPSAAQRAQAALDRISPSGWGVALGGPLSTLVRALTGMGRFEQAAEQLNQPVPENLYQTTFGLFYLHARGQYYLAANRLLAAFDDFHACGELMQKWRLDIPALVPWRTDAAQVCLMLGRHAEARSLLEEQLVQVADGQSRIRGAALRRLAATTDLARRAGILREATDLLADSGDQLELAHALADLGETYRRLGESNRARTVIRRAYHVAEVCGAEPLCCRLMPRPAGRRVDDPATGPMEAPADRSGSGTELSDAERRVASLAAQGHSNREIASRLYVTISTVEQHLTRVYRKLNVTRRAQLANLFEVDAA